MTREKPIALFDMDNSLFDFEGAMRRSLEAMRSPDEPEIRGLWELDEVPWMKARIRAIKSIPGWWRSLPPLENGFRVYELAKEIGFKNSILTKGPRKAHIAWTEKLQCCQDHLGEDIDVTVTMDKGNTYGRVLYDDYTEYMEVWLKHRPRGLGIMPVNESNKNWTHPQVVKWDGTNIDEVRRALEAAYARADGEEWQV